jgi:hypothetical protein
MRYAAVMRAPPARMLGRRRATAAANRRWIRVFALAGRGVNDVVGRVDVIAIVARVNLGLGPSLVSAVRRANARIIRMRFSHEAHSSSIGSMSVNGAAGLTTRRCSPLGREWIATSSDSFTARMVSHGPNGQSAEMRQARGPISHPSATMAPGPDQPRVGGPVDPLGARRVLVLGVFALTSILSKAWSNAFGSSSAPARRAASMKRLDCSGSSGLWRSASVTWVARSRLLNC